MHSNIPKSLRTIAYNAVAEKYGLSANNIIVGTQYKFLDLGCVDFISLGQCLENVFSPGYYQNDFTPSRTLRFELNNDAELLKTSFYGYHGNQNVHMKVNIYVDN
jgi:hypothetical protein